MAVDWDWLIDIAELISILALFGAGVGACFRAFLELNQQRRHMNHMPNTNLSDEEHAAVTAAVRRSASATIKARVFGDHTEPATWRVEREVVGDGDVEVAVFGGPNAHARAIRYADHQYGDFDEIELTPLLISPAATSSPPIRR